MPRNSNPVPQYFDNSNKILSGGLMYYFEAGTSTPKETYSDNTESTPNTHPVVLDAYGRLPNVFFSGTAKQVLKDKDGVQIWERDDVGSTVTTGDFNQWQDTIDYSVGDIVSYNDKYWVSLQTPNQNQTPENGEFWSEIRFIDVWNENVDYSVGEIAQTSDGSLWKSIQSPNTNQNPLTDDASEYWIAAVDGDKIKFNRVIQHFYRNR